jgi:hypothetical protein
MKLESLTNKAQKQPFLSFILLFNELEIYLGRDFQSFQ